VAPRAVAPRAVASQPVGKEEQLPQSTEEFIEAFRENKRPVGRQPFQSERDSRPAMRMNSRPRQAARSGDQRSINRNFDSRPAPGPRTDRPRSPRSEERQNSEEPLLNRKARRALKFSHLEHA